MADNQEDVVYQFTGDVSSLRQATESAIGLLSKYQAQIDRISADGGFGKNIKAAKSFQSQINATTKQVTNMQKQMKGISDVRLFPSAPVTQQLQGSLISINQVFDRLASSSKLSTKEVQALTAQLRSTNASLKGNSAEVTALVQKEQKWQQTLDGVRNKTTQFRDSLDTLRGRISGVFDPMVSKMNSLSAPFTKITAKLQSFRDKASETFGKVSQLASTVAAAFRRVSTAESDSADATNKSTNAHSRLRSILASIQNAFTKETSSVDKEQDILKRKNDTLKDSTRRHSSLRDILINLGRTFSSESNSVRTFNTNLKSLNSASKLLKNALTGLISIPIAQWLAEAAKQSISYAENLNLFKVAMGDSLDVGTEFIARMAEIYGMDPSSLMRYAGNFYQLADAIDMPDESAAKLSLSLLKATNDISSLFNVPIEKVFNDLSSGMQGMSRAVRKYGMDIRATTLQQTALSLGITENVETMSEANRQGLRFITMMRQASNASGDFARTIESPANQLKIFKEQLAVFGRSIGNLFIGPLTTAIAYINGFIMALSTVIRFIASLFGIFTSLFGGGADSAIEAADGVANSVNNIGGAAGGAAKELKQMLAPLDELNVLQDQASGGGGGGGGGGALSDIGTLDPAIAAEIEKMEMQLENVRMKAVEVRDALLEFFGFQVEDGVILSWDASKFEDNLINKFPQWTKTIQAVFDNWTDIINAFGSVLEALAGIAQAVWEKVTAFIGKFVNDDTVSAFISGLADDLNAFASFLNSNQDAIANFVIALGAMSAAFKGFSVISTLIEPVVTFISTCVSALAPFASVINWAAAIIAVIAVLYTTSNTFAASFNALIVSIGEGLGAVFAAFWESLQVVWAGIQTLWADNILPMITSIGDAIAPVVDTIIDLWEDLVEIIVDAFDMVEAVWSNTLQPVLAAFFDAIGNLAEIFGTLWSEVIGPVVGNIGDGIATLWKTTLRPIFENLIAIIGGVIEIILALWNNVLAPVVNWLVYVLAPIFVNIFNTIWNIVREVVEGIGQSINGLLKIFRGLIDFIAGVFTGNWSRVWQGVVGIFEGIWNTLAGVVKTVLNSVIGVINAALGAISGAINAIIRAVNTISFRAPAWVPGVGGKTLGFNISEVGSWSIPYLASGAVVTSPTLAMVGEGKYDEAVIPLGNSPQIKELVNQIADATKNRGVNDPIQVNVYIGNEQIAEYMHRADRRRQLQTNGG